MPNLQNCKSLIFQEGSLEVRNVEAEKVETVETVEEIGGWDKQLGRGLNTSSDASEMQPNEPIQGPPRVKV